MSIKNEPGIYPGSFHYQAYLELQSSSTTCSAGGSG